MKFNYLNSALNIGELATVMMNISCDDKKDMTSYSIYVVRYQAQYVLSCYHEGGHSLNEDLTGEYGKIAERLARSEIKKLEKFIARCDKVIAKNRSNCGYDYKKDVCDRCHTTKEEALKHPVDVGINHWLYRYSTSFYLNTDGGALCAKCHKEKGLEDLFKTMDAIDAKKAAEGKPLISYKGEQHGK